MKYELGEKTIKPNLPKYIELKIAPAYFEMVASGDKTFEIRKNDRDFKVGDVVVLWEFKDNKYTGRNIDTVISCITDYEQKDGYVVLGIFVGSVNEKAEDEQPVSIEYAKEIIETVHKSHFAKPIKEPLKTRQVIVKFFDSQEYRTELTEDAARELIEFLEASKK